MYLSNIKSKLQKVQACKKENLQKCKSTSYLQSTLSQSQNQATKTDLQWLSSGPRWICCGSYTSRAFKSCLVGFLRHGGEITCEITGRQRRSGVDGKGLEVLCVYTFMGKPRICLSYYLSSVYHSTGFHQSHNSHKRFLKMPLVVAVVSTSWNRILLAFMKPGQSPKASQNATHWNSIYYRDRSNLVVEIQFLEFLWI